MILRGASSKVNTTVIEGMPLADRRTLVIAINQFLVFRQAKLTFEVELPSIEYAGGLTPTVLS